MSALVGFVTAAAQYGLQTILVRPKRQIADFTMQVVIDETHHDELEITNHPIEQGSTISDHAFMRPAELTVRCGWSNSPSVPGLFGGLAAGLPTTIDAVQSLLSGSTADQVREIYAKLLKLQASRIPFSVFTGKRNYDNMLMKSLTTVTDKDTENALIITASFVQLIIVKTQLLNVAADAGNQANASATQPTSDEGTKQLTPSTRYDDGR